MRPTVCLALLLLAFPATSQIRLPNQLPNSNVPPSINSFAPVMARPGQTVSVHVEGAGFLPGTTFEIGQPGGVTVQRVVIDNPRQAEITLRVDINASPGMRPLFVQHGAGRGQARGGFIVQPAQGLPGGATQQLETVPAARISQLPGTTVQTPQQQTAPPRLSPNVSQVQAPQQQQVSPRLTPNLQAGNLQNGQQIQTQVPISGNLAQRQEVQRPNTAIAAVNPAQGGVHSQAGMLSTIQLVGPLVNVITPSQLIPGSMNVPITITGSLFTAGTTVSFDPAIVAQGRAQYVNSTKLKVVVNVAAGAPVGAHEVTISNPDRHTARSQVNVVAAKRRVEIPPLQGLRPKFAALVNLKEGVIYLSDPGFGKTTGGMDSNLERDRGMPVLDDDTVFNWSEHSRGLAEYYEIRFYARDGKTLLDKRRIDGKDISINTSTGKPANIHVVPTTFRPDAALVAELMQKVNPSGTYRVNYGQAHGPVSMAGNAVTGTSNSASGSGSLSLKDGDMQWEVAGFRHYGAPVQRKEVAVNPGMLQQASLAPTTLAQNADNAVEIEISERWPLGRADAPTGLAGTTPVSKSGLAAINVGAKAQMDANGKPTSKVDTNNYPGDIFMLQGTFDFAKAPYAQHPKLTTNPVSNTTSKGSMINTSTIPTLKSARFDNVFVDWGDGTIQPIEALVAATDEYEWQRGVGMKMSTFMTSAPMITSGQILATIHKYRSFGSYQVRVFELAEADAQAINSSALAMALDESGSSFATGIKLAGFKPRSFTHAVSGINVGSDDASQMLATVMARGYLLYSTTEVVIPREDLLASGPLNLDSIKVDFNEPGQNAGGMHAAYPVANRTTTLSGARMANPAVITATQAGPPAPASGASAGTHCSKCDESMMATATLSYYGKGEARVTWYIDNQAIYSETYPVGPSDQRTNVPADGKGTPLLNSFQVHSPALSGASLGSHLVHVEAQVIPSWRGYNLTLLHNEILDGARIARLANPAVTGAATRNAGARMDSAVVGGSLTHAQFSHVFLRMAQNRIGVTQKLGVLSPNRRAIPGIPAVADMQAALNSLGGNLTLAMNSLPKEKPYYVFSGREQYTVDPPALGLCTVLFPTKGGTFHVTGLQNHAIKNSDGSYSGSGKLVLYLTDSPSSAAQLSPVVVPIDHWQLGADGKTVQKGAIDVSPGVDLLALPAVTGKLQRVTATAGATNDLLATLALQVSDGTLTTTAAPQKPPVLGALQAPLSSSGDWYKSGVAMQELRIGWSSFRINPSNGVTVDLSRTAGDPVSTACASTGAGAGFVGIHLGNATLTPYTMELTTMTKQVTDWGISGSGLCGVLDTGPYSAKFSAGSGGQVSFDSLHAEARNGLFTALYKNMTVHVPWLDVDLKANVMLQSGGGQQSAMQFNFPQPAPVTKTYSNSTLTAKDFVFTKAELIGWALYSSTTFNIKSENKPFATVPDVPVYYGMDGIPYFAKQAQSMVIPLHGASSLGSAPLDLVSVAVATAPNSSNNHILDFDFTTKVHLSTALPAADMHVIYGLVRLGTNNGGGTYKDTAVSNLPFEVPMVFPAADPSVNTVIHPNYQPGGGAAFQDANHTSHSSGGGTIFEERDVSLGLFGSSNVKGSFKLGYGPSGDDFWIAKAAFPLSPAGLDVLPPFLTLYKIFGGMGHNVSSDAFRNPDSNLDNVGYTANQGTLFSAGVTAGSSDGGFTYKADGDLTIQVGGSGAGAQLALSNGKLLGVGNFNGYFKYANHNFDGDLNGEMNLLDGVVDINGDANVHYGMDDKTFHVNLGTRDAPLSATLMGFGGSTGYMMAGNDQDPNQRPGPLVIAVGGGQTFHLGVGDSSVASAYVDAFMNVGMTVQAGIPPHVTGSFDAGADAGVCVVSVCDSASVNAHVTASALPIQMTAEASIDLGWLLGSVDFTVSLK